jgi:hypothetical protein
MIQTNKLPEVKKELAQAKTKLGTVGASGRAADEILKLII